MRKLITSKQLAMALGITRRNLFKLQKLDRFPRYVLGRSVRYDLDEVMEFFKEHKKDL